MAEWRLSMKIIMYGTQICSDCVEAKEMLKDKPDVLVEYKDITENTTNLKEFLAYRDNDRIFHEVKEEGRIGIPFFVLDDGTKTFDITQYVHTVTQKASENPSCSIDGKGC